MDIAVFVTIWSMALSPADLKNHLMGEPLEYLSSRPKVQAVELYRPATGELPPLHDTPAPAGIIEVRVSSVKAAVKLVTSSSFQKLILNEQAYPANVESIDLEVLEPVHYAIPGHKNPPPRTAPLSFVVRYYGPVADAADFINFYTTNHPPLLAQFPGIRNVLCYLPVDWKDTKKISDPSVIIGNEVVFDDLASFNAALASEALGPVMADADEFAPYGLSTHYAMLRELVYARGTKQFPR